MVKEKTLADMFATADPFNQPWHVPRVTKWRLEMHDDIASAFGPIRALLAKRKRALRAYEAAKDFRWHGDRHLRDLRNIELDIRFALFIGE
jgi:hypothetical protein